MSAVSAAAGAGPRPFSAMLAGGRATTVMTMGLIAIIAMMVLPAPAIILDIGLTVSFALSMLVFAITLFIQRPVEFSGFPTILLGAVMLRLSLNISSTRLIIAEGHTGTDAAGAVIQGFAMFIMDGNIFIGLVVFSVIMIVNFMVITKGAGRMAEVGARFALDGMPGKQLAIDSDVAAGAITHEEAQARRKREQDETAFFGSLDGASKFVKGDAVAGLVITALNVIVGISVGVGAHGLTFGEAVETYSILTVGDGLVSQLPAVIISVAAALLMSKGGASGTTDLIVMGQLGAHPLALFTVAGCMAVFAIVPGLPFGFFFTGAALLTAAGVFLHRERAASEKRTLSSAPAPVRPERTLGDHLALDEIQVEFAMDLAPLVLDATMGLETRISRIRSFVAAEFGFVVPPVRLTDNAELAPGEYVILIHGVEFARFRLKPDQILILVDEGEAAAFPGESVSEPVFGAPARWQPASRREDALAQGAPVIDPGEVLATHLLEAIKVNFGRLMTRRAMRRLLDEAVRTTDPARSEALRQLIDELVPDKAPVETAQSVFRLLLEEGVSVRNIGLILETIAEVRPWSENAEQIAEHVRRRLSKQISASLRNERGEISLIQLSPEWEQVFQKHEVLKGGSVKEVALPPDEFNRLSRAIQDQIRKAAAQGIMPAVVTFGERRRFIRTVLIAKGVRNPVVAYDELDLQSKPVLVGTA
jgi:flagellar biosynthesis protein FlhA